MSRPPAYVQQAEETWTHLEKGLEEIKILIEGGSSRPWELKQYLDYTNKVYGLVKQHETQKILANHIQAYIVNLCTGVIMPILKDLRDQQFLSELSVRWYRFKLFCKIISLLYSHLDNGYFNPKTSKPGEEDNTIQQLQPFAYTQFRTRVFKDLHKTSQNLILSFIDKDRDGEAVDVTMLKNAVDLFIMMDPKDKTYYRDLEREYLSRTSTFYRNMATKALQTDTSPEYMIKCENAFAAENQRIKNYMSSSSQIPVRDTLIVELLQKHVKELLDMEHSGFVQLVEGNKLEDLARMYSLMRNLDNGIGIIPMSKDFQVYMMSVGNEMMKNQEIIQKNEGAPKEAKKPAKDEAKPEAEEGMVKDEPEPEDGAKKKKKKKKKKSAKAEGDDDAAEPAEPAPKETGEDGAEGGEGDAADAPKKKKKKIIKKTVKKVVNETQQNVEFVDSLLKLYSRFNKMYLECFQSNKFFNDAIKNAFTDFLNQTSVGKSCPELLAIFVDDFVKKKQAQQVDDFVKTTFDEVVALLNYLHEKDKFMENYKTLLAKRLLTQYDQSTFQEETERYFLTLLKNQHGHAFTADMDGMFSDHSSANTLQEAFDTYVVDERLNLNIDLQVQIITDSHWPRFMYRELQLKPVLQNALAAFEKFYKSRHNNRSLRWLHSNATLVMSLKFAKKTCEVTMTSEQGNLLSEFNEGTFSFVDIATRLGLDQAETKRLVISLMNPKNPILCVIGDSSEETTDLKETDKVAFNIAHDPIKKKFRIQAPSVLSAFEKKGIATAVDELRKFQIQCAICRIVKAAKGIEFTQLQTNVLEQLNLFHPTTKEIKLGVEDLIERDYIERDAKQNDRIILKS
ncbi:putative Cullin [Blattamonas nauphoetae]|uniref:Cullin n=1 Tax=Blattamonas nauphoetae TaxID=2049346 RepID=A0ABQ9XTD9_9EUKA|nr:putative Cullin [Blattamonas nauphoetae]